MFVIKYLVACSSQLIKLDFRSFYFIIFRQVIFLFLAVLATNSTRFNEFCKFLLRLCIKLSVNVLPMIAKKTARICPIEINIEYTGKRRFKFTLTPVII
ncbi:MAG: hypothetical protein D0528_11850 [Methylococcales bacterium]|nr:MAG: hypothetical protein D0528_11850 [Methylococcales bacterium]